MGRIRDYASFAAWFIGLGYIILWPLAAPHVDLEAGSARCRDGHDLLRQLCEVASPARLPPLLHLLGLTAAIFVIVRLLLIALRAARKASDQQPAEPPRRRRRPPRTVMRVKARDHFGLRGLSD